LLLRWSLWPFDACSSLFVVASARPSDFVFSFDFCSAKGKGGKNRRRGKNTNDDEKREIVVKSDGQVYAQVNLELTRASFFLFFEIFVFFASSLAALCRFALLNAFSIAFVNSFFDFPLFLVFWFRFPTFLYLFLCSGLENARKWLR
jgi:hypothetical protein